MRPRKLFPTINCMDFNKLWLAMKCASNLNNNNYSIKLHSTKMHSDSLWQYLLADSIFSFFSLVCFVFGTNAQKENHENKIELIKATEINERNCFIKICILNYQLYFIFLRECVDIIVDCNWISFQLQTANIYHMVYSMVSK